MREDDFRKYTVNVRSMIEFLLRHGDIMPGDSFFSPERAQLGAEIHRKMQNMYKTQKPGYTAEKSLRREYLSFGVTLVLEGRCDGFYFTEDESDSGKTLHVDEIKTIEYEIENDSEPEILHIAQAACYGALLINYDELYSDNIEIHIIYVNINSNKVTEITKKFSGKSINDYVNLIVFDYFNWILYDSRRRQSFQAELNEFKFPFESYRKGQRELAVSVYKTITESEGTNLFINAPTGIGKTASMLFPALKAMSSSKKDIKKIFYFTAANSGSSSPQFAASLFSSQLKSMLSITLTSKEKICPNAEPDCHPDKCERAKGHYDRVNNAIYEALQSNQVLTCDCISSISQKHCVCPFETQLDISLWCDIIIGDYNYLFDPTAKLQRYFSEDKKLPYVYLIDEAHNLPSRAREMYSARLSKKEFTHMAKLLKSYDDKAIKKLNKNINAISRQFSKMHKEAEDFPAISSRQDTCLSDLCKEYLFAAYDLLKKKKVIPDEIRKEFMELYFNVRFFNQIDDIFDENFYAFFDKDYSYTLFCANPAEIIHKISSSGLNAAFFSATLLPFDFFVNAIGGTENDRLIKIPSPFPKENCLTIAATDVYTTYSKRTEYYSKIAEYIKMIAEYAIEKCGGKGNFMVFFSSYKFLDDVLACLEEDFLKKYICVQPKTKSQSERENFINGFKENPDKIHIGFCVLGGVFSEGIDLPGSRLSGVMIVGVGLPMVSTENELISMWYESENTGSGFENAYVFPGINKVVQAAGRVIRTMSDKGFVILLDNRYQKELYSSNIPSANLIKKTKNINETRQVLNSFLLT